MTEKNQINPFDAKDKIKVMVGEPSGGMIDCIAHDNRLDFVMELARLEARRPFKFFTGNVGRSGVAWAREQMAKEAIKQGMDYLFMLDDDMIVPRRCFERVFDVMMEHKADMAAPLCTQRVHPFNPVLYKHAWIEREGVKDGFKYLQNQFIDDYVPDSVTEVDGIGFGVVLISVPLLKKMMDGLIPGQGLFFSNNLTGEDIWFCMKARQEYKAKIVVDTSIKVGHLRHPEMASEFDWVKAKGLEKRFENVYGPGKKPAFVWQDGPEVAA